MWDYHSDNWGYQIFVTQYPKWSHIPINMLYPFDALLSNNSTFDYKFAINAVTTEHWWVKSVSCNDLLYLLILEVL